MVGHLSHALFCVPAPLDAGHDIIVHHETAVTAGYGYVA
jgi:hypothetical protein